MGVGFGYTVPTLTLFFAGVGREFSARLYVLNSVLGLNEFFSK